MATFAVRRQLAPLTHTVQAHRERIAPGTLTASARLMTLYFLLNLGDLLTTYVGLHVGLREGNPLMAGLLGSYGFGALIAYKAVVVALVLVGGAALYSLYPRVARATLVICNLLVGGAVVVNLLQCSIQ